MADGRMLRRSIATNEQLAAVSLEAAFVFTWCLPFLDVEGRMYGSPLRVKALVFPLREEINAGVIERALTELHEVGLITWYEARGEKCLAFPGFLRNNTVRPKREGKSKVPPPPVVSAPPTLRLDNAAGTAGTLPEYSGSTPAERKLSERKGSEVKGSTPARKQPRAGGMATPAFNYAPFVDAYRQRFGVDPDRKDAAILKRLVESYGHDEVLARWTRFLAAKGEFGVTVFRRTWGDWTGADRDRRDGGRPAHQNEAERMYDLLTKHGLLDADKDVFTAQVTQLCEDGVIRDKEAFIARVRTIDLQRLREIPKRHFALAYIVERFEAARARAGGATS